MCCSLTWQEYCAEPLHTGWRLSRKNSSVQKLHTLPSTLSLSLCHRQSLLGTAYCSCSTGANEFGKHCYTCFLRSKYQESVFRIATLKGTYREGSLLYRDTCRNLMVNQLVWKWFPEGKFKISCFTGKFGAKSGLLALVTNLSVSEFHCSNTERRGTG